MKTISMLKMFTLKFDAFLVCHSLGQSVTCMNFFMDGTKKPNPKNPPKKEGKKHLKVGFCFFTWLDSFYWKSPC